MWKTITGLLILTIPSFAVPPASQPSTTQTAKSAPKQKFTLMNGAVRFLVPSAWTEQDRSDDGRKAIYRSPDEKATIYVNVLPQDYPIPQRNEGFREKMKASILTAMKKTFAEKKMQMLYGPQSETDDRFLLRIHDREKTDEGILDEVHLYRAAGLDLLSVTTVVHAETADEAKPYHVVGEDTCLGIVLGPAEKKRR